MILCEYVVNEMVGKLIHEPGAYTFLVTDMYRYFGARKVYSQEKIAERFFVT